MNFTTHDYVRNPITFIHKHVSLDANTHNFSCYGIFGHKLLEQGADWFIEVFLTATSGSATRAEVCFLRRHVQVIVMCFAKYRKTAIRIIEIKLILIISKCSGLDVFLV